MNRITATKINPPPGQAEANRFRIAADHRKAIQRAEANVWRREQAILNTKNPARRERAKRRLEVARAKLVLIKIQGDSKPPTGRAHRIPR